MSVLPLRTVALSGVLASGLALLVAHGSEAWGELIPCALCLWERWPYRIAALCGVLAALLSGPPARALIWLMIAAIAAGAALGFVHVGVEFGWWPSPLPECAAGPLSMGSIADRLASMPARPSKPCDQPVFLIPGLPLSMAAMNFLYALTLAAVLAVVTVERRHRR
jgi:disulfide bond formation protein DsbB